MTPCENRLEQIALYVDGELAAKESLEVEEHLSHCGGCRGEYEELRSTVDMVRSGGPMYGSATESYQRVEAMVGAWQQRRRWMRMAPLMAAAAALVITAGVMASSHAVNYENFAARAHRLHERRGLPLDIASSQPAAISDWLKPRLPFAFALPSYSSEGPKRYSLKGARLMQFDGQDVAYLAYEMDRKPISLLISSARIGPSGSESLQSGGMTFYFSNESGLRVMSWKHGGMVYAQVSDVNVKPTESCGICHG